MTKVRLSGCTILYEQLQAEEIPPPIAVSPREGNLQISIEVMSALIGVASALAVVAIKDIVVDTVRNRRERGRDLIRQRLENAYVPLNYLIYALATSEGENVGKFRNEILQILKRYGHLLTKQTLSGFYTIVDEANQIEIDTGLAKRFFQEYQSLREAFYRDRSNSPLIIEA